MCRIALHIDVSDTTGIMNILFLYNSTQTYTNTVFEQINSFAKFSRHATFFCHLDQISSLELDLSRFDAVAIHYSIRLPFDQIFGSAARTLKNYSGLKFLFIQDEYDYTCRAWHWINELGIRLVFTAVPEVSIPRVYPPDRLPGVQFVNNLTGYVPENLDFTTERVPASKREIVFGYRGRPLHVRYGSLGKEKVAIGEIVSKYCRANGIRCDIAWSEAEKSMARPGMNSCEAAARCWVPKAAAMSSIGITRFGRK